MKLKFKNQTRKIFIAFITILAFSSCKQKDFDKEIYGYTDAESIGKPNEDKIKNDILNNKVGSWTFSKLEEFNDFTITNSRIVDEFNLEIDVTLDLSDYITGKPYQGNVTVSYSRIDRKNDYWEFNEVTGSVSEVITEEDNSQDVSSESNYQEQQQDNKSSEYPLCDWCDEVVIGKHYFVIGDGQKVTDNVSWYNGVVYHQNCANEYCDSKR